MGLIREKVDIKILILYIMRRLPAAVDNETLYDLCCCDGDIVYFDYIDCLSDLEESKHIKEVDGGLVITEKGKRNSDAVGNSLPFSVRKKADKAVSSVEDVLARAAMITAAHEINNDGCIVKLGLSDGKGRIMSLDILVSDENQARKIKRNFRLKAEKYYSDFIKLLER